MILRNYYKVIELVAKGDTSGNYASFKDTNGITKKIRYNYNNTDSYLRCVGLWKNSLSISSSATTDGIQFGTGETAPTFDDYKLSGNIITGLTGTISSTCVNDDNGNFVTTIIATLTNTNTADVTIGEVGWCRSFSGVQPTGSSNAFAYILLDRTVLNTPVTIPAGGIGQVTYTIRFNYPTA